MAVYMNAIGRNIRDIRRGRKMTQAQVAERIGMTLLHFGRLERGERNVSLVQLDRIAGLFEVPTRVLLRGAFPDEALEDGGGEMKADSAREVGHLMQSMNERERALVLGLCRLMIQDN